MILLILTNLLRARDIEQHPVFLITQVYIETLRRVFAVYKRNLRLIHFCLQYYRLKQIGLLAVLLHLIQHIWASFFLLNMSLLRASQAALEILSSI